MDDTREGFLDDTSISKTPRSPLLASTAARINNNKKSRSIDPKSVVNSFTITDGAALNEVTNVAQMKYKYDKTLDSFATEANSSLGILQMDNFSDFTDTSFQMPENIWRSKKKLKKPKLFLPRQENVSSEAKSRLVDETKSNASSDSEIDGESSSDIEYDGTNIPELNFDCDIGILTGETGNIQENNCTSSSKKISEFLESLNIENKTSAEAQESIFSSFEPTYQELFKEHVDKEHPVDVSVDFKSPAVDSILQKDQFEEKSFLQNLQKLSSSQMMPDVNFCPEEISARSSSFKSSSNIVNSLSQSVDCNSLFLTPGKEDLKDEIVTGSWFTDHKMNFPLQERDSDILSYSNGDVGQSGSLPCSSLEGEPKNEREIDFKLDPANFSSASNLLSSSHFGISDSDFVKPGKVKTMLKNDEEVLEQEQMFEISSVSKLSDSSSTPLATSSLDCHSPENHQLSIGALLGARSEHIGTLSEDSCRDRPYFGTKVSTPTKPYLDVSRNSGSEEEKSAENTVSSISNLNCMLSSETVCGASNIFPGDRGLSELFENASTARPSRLASKIFENCRPLLNSTAKITSSSGEISQYESRSETPDSSYLTQTAPSRNVTLTVMQSNADQNSLLNLSDSIETTSMNGTLTNAANDNPLLNITHLDGAKVDDKTCPNCQFCFQNTASSTRPSSSCSSCSSIPLPPLSTQNFLTTSKNCFHSGMLYNAAAYGAVQPPVMTFFPPLHAALPGYNPYHLQAPNNLNAVQGPDELQYPEKLLIGVTKQLKLQIQNTRHCPCFYEVTSVAATNNDIPVPINLLGVSFPPIVKCNNGGACEIEITLSPNFDGKVRVELLLACYVITDGTSAIPLKTTIKYEALRPTIKISSKGKNCLNMGPIIAGSTVIEYVTVENASEVTVPIYLNLSDDIKRNRISFCENQMRHQKGVKVVSPKLMLFELPRSHPGSSHASRLDIPITFEADKSDVDVNFTLTAGIESKSLKDVLSSLNISASVRITRLVLSDPSQNPLRFHIREGIVLKKSLRVKNQGPLHVTYDLLIEDDSNSFSMFPTTLSLQPSETSTVFITFSSSVFQEAEYSLKAAAQPHGQVFKVADIFGSVQRNPVHSFKRGAQEQQQQSDCGGRHSYHECENIVEVTKKYLAWGGVDIGSSLMKDFTLRNALNRPLQLKLFVKETSQSFQLLNQNNKTSQSLILDLEPKEEKNVSVVFSPNTTVICSGILGMKPTYENGKTSYSIPLSGYGGLGKLKVLGIPEKEGIGYCLDMAVTNGKLTFYNIDVQNTGARAIFVKVILSSGGADNYTERISVHPSEFVLMENENKVIVISCTFPSNYLVWNASNLGLMTLVYGDEIMRHQLRRNELNRKEQSEVLGIDYYPGVKFTSHFDGEEKVPYDSSCQSTPKDASLFASSLKKILIHLNPESQDNSYSRINFEALSTIENGYASILGQSAASTIIRRLTTFHEAHSPPEKESAVFHKQCSTPHQLFPTSQSKPEEQSAGEENNRDNWIVKPEELCLDSSSKDSRIVLINHSKQDLKFRVECPIDIISVSPLNGVLPAKSQIGLRCRIIPNSLDKISGDSAQHVRIICGSSEKTVHVKVAQDPKRLKGTSRLSLNADGGNTTQIRGAVSSNNNDTTSVAFVIRNIFDFPKEITLPTTEPGDTSETLLVFQNTAKNSVHWKIIASTLIFSQSLEDICSGNILKIHPLSGVLNPMETCTITIVFSPVTLNSYSQFLEFCIESEKKETKEKCNFKITGRGALNVSSSAEGRKSNSNVRGTNKPKKSKTSVYLEDDVCKFQAVTAGKSTVDYVTLKNASDLDVLVTLIKPKPPFSVQQSSVTVRTKKYLKVPILFKPTCRDKLYEDQVVFQMANCDNLIVKLKGYCCV